MTEATTAPAVNVWRRRAFQVGLGAALVFAVAVPLGSYFASMLFQGILGQPPVKEFYDPSNIMLDVQTFGAYPTTVVSLSLRESEGGRTDRKSVV